MEFMIHDRLSWLRFLGLSFGDQTPDENTIRHFRNRLIATGTLTRVMKAFDWQLQKKGYIPMSGQIVDASLVPLQSSAIPRANARRSSLGRARKKSGRTNRTRPLSKAAARANAAKSSIRSHVEHVFAHQKNRFGLFIRTIGVARAEAKLTLCNLAYNFNRLIFHERRECSG
jgi:IS5 family transposase